MIVSTKGRYALRVMIDLSEHGSERYIPLKEISARQEISEKYLESILSVLSRERLVLAQRGKGGGYRLARPADGYTVGEILRSAEGALAPVSCPECLTSSRAGGRAASCPRSADCKTLPLWQGLSRLIDDYFERVTLAELARPATGGTHYVI
ncbi:MAG: RrF2 family transcriptional regulator [Eubacteriales bacterium]